MSAIEVWARPWRSLREAERRAYRAVTSDCPHGTVFHTPEWLDAIEEAFEPDTRCLLAYVQGRLVGGFPFFTLDGPWPGHTNHSCLRDHDMVYGGPVSAGTLQAGLTQHDVLSRLLERFEAGSRTMVSSLLPPSGFPVDLLISRGYRMSTHLTALIDLNRPSDSVWASVHSKTRNMIRKALRAGLKVRQATPEDLTILPEMIAAPFHRASRQPPPPRFIHLIAHHLSRAGLARVLVAVGADGRPVAGSMFLRHERRSYYWAGGALPAGYDTAASHLLQWEGIDTARAEGCHEHDLVMIDPVSAPGIARFKLRFGARLEPVGAAVRRRLIGRVLGRVQRLAARPVPGSTGPQGEA